MFKKIYWFVVLLIFGCSSQPKTEDQTPEIEKGIAADNDKLSKEVFYIDTPQELMEYSEDQKLQKYPGANRPDKVYGDIMGTVSIGISLNVENVTEDELPLFTKSAKEGLLKNTNVEWISDTYKVINGRKFAVLEFYSSSMHGGLIYNMMTSVSHDNKLAMITFNCMKNDMGKWVDEFQMSLESIHFDVES